MASWDSNLDSEVQQVSSDHRATHPSSVSRRGPNMMPALLTRQWTGVSISSTARAKLRTLSSLNTGVRVRIPAAARHYLMRSR